MKTTNRILALILGFTLASTVILAQKVGDTAPDFSLTTTDNINFNLSEQSGKVVFLFTFGYGCFHCADNAPNTESGIYQKFKDKPNFVALAFDTWGGNKSSVESFADAAGLNYPVATMGESVANSYGIGYDRMVVIDAKGIIQYISPGYATSTNVNNAAAVIESLLTNSGNVSRIEQNSLSEIQVFEANGLLKINYDFNGVSSLNVRLVDITGRESVNTTIEANAELPIEHLKKGLYLVIIENKGDFITQKILIEN